MGFWNVDRSHAYAVIAGTLTVTIKGQTVTRTGTLAYTFSKHGEEWKIDAKAWGRHVLSTLRSGPSYLLANARGYSCDRHTPFVVFVPRRVQRQLCCTTIRCF